MKLASVHRGDRLEYLAEFALSTIGLTTPVPRQSDYFLVDCIVHPFRDEARSLVLTGQAFGCQIKSNSDPIKIERPENLGSFFFSSLPFFICLIERVPPTAKG